MAYPLQEHNLQGAVVVESDYDSLDFTLRRVDGTFVTIETDSDGYGWCGFKFTEKPDWKDENGN